MFYWLRYLVNRRNLIVTPDVHDLLTANVSSSGISVNHRSVLGIPAIWRGLNLVSQKVGKLPLCVYRRLPDGGCEPATDHPAWKLLKKRPSPDLSPFVFKQTLMLHALIYGNGYFYVFRDQNGDPSELGILDPSVTHPYREGGTLGYVTTVDGQDRKLLADNVGHIKGLSYDGIQGLSTLDVLKESLGLSQAIQKYTSVYFANAGKPSVVITLPVGLKDPDKIERFRRTWGDIHTGLDNAHRPALLENGASVTPLSGGNEDAQLTELTDQQVRACANILGVPPSYLGVTDGYTSHNSLEQQTKQFLSDTLDGWLTNWEEVCEQVLLRETEKDRDTHYVEFNRQALDQTDTKTQEDVLILQLSNNAISWEEYRKIKNLPVDRSGTFFRQANVNAVEGETFQPPEPPTPEPAPQPDQPEPPPDAPAASQDDSAARFDRLTQSVVRRLVERVKRSVEAHATKGDLRDWLPTLADDHRSVCLESLDAFDTAPEVTDTFLSELRHELDAISVHDISHIQWDRYRDTFCRALGA